MEYSLDSVLENTRSVNYLFNGIQKDATRLDEETYILEALFPQGAKHGYQINTEKNDLAFIARWTEDKFPLKICVGPDYGYLFNPLEMKILSQSVQEVLNRIHQLDPYFFNFVIVPDRLAADVLVKFRRTNGTLSGCCNQEIGREKQLTSADVIIHIPKSMTCEQIAHPKVLLTIAHNLLHALGIYGHSSSPADTTHKEWTSQQQLITPRDGQTLSLLYRCPLAITQKDLLRLWQDYQDKSLLLSMDDNWSMVISKICEKELLNPANGILLKPSSSTSGLSTREFALREWFNRYIQKIKTA